MNPPPSSNPIPIKKTSTLRYTNLPNEIQPFLDSVDIVSSTPPVHTYGLMAPSVTVGPLATSFHWMHDSESDECLRCHAKFTFSNRQHHCRVCGSLVCASCSKEQECPAKLVHEQPTSASVLKETAKTMFGYLTSWTQKTTPPSSPNSTMGGGAADDDVVFTRVCCECARKIEEQDTLQLYELIERVFTDQSQYKHVLDLRNWDDLATQSSEWSRLVSIFRQAMAQSQHFVTNPWIKGYRNTTILQKKVQSLVLWANYPLFEKHYFYSHAWLIQKSTFETCWPELSTKPSPITIDPGTRCSCEILRCKIRCDAEPTLEMRMHTLFSAARLSIQTSHVLPLPLALALMPTMLLRGTRDTFYLSCIATHLTQYGACYGAPLYAWLHSIVCTGAYLDQVGNMFPSAMLTKFIRSLKWSQNLRDALRACKSVSATTRRVKFSKLRHLNAHPNVLVPGSHTHRIKTVFLRQVRRTQSNSSPYLVPCLIEHVETGIVTREMLLVKHNQSMFNDWVSMALVQFCADTSQHANVQTYHMAPTGPHSGIIVVVPDSLTLYEASQKNSIFNLMYEAQAKQQVSVQDMRTKFSSSLAFFTILSCFLGWRDRIPSNMMIHPKSGTLFHIDFEYLLDQAPFWKHTLRKYSGSQSGGFQYSGDNVTMTSLIPPSALDMIGGYKSEFYQSTFHQHCNQFYSEFYKLRHVFYYATECLCFVPSRVGKIACAHHEKFFRTLELTFLRGILITPSARQARSHSQEDHETSGGGGSDNSFVNIPISPLVIDQKQHLGWGLEKIFATLHNTVQKFRTQ